MSDWKPKFTLNLLETSSRSFANFLAKFEGWAASEKTEPLQIKTGWHVVTPEMAEQFLKHNNKNRSVHFPTVYAYALTLTNGNWKKTGQPLIFTKNNTLCDGQHRLWACYLTKRSFETYIVMDVDDDDGFLFAYIDNNKPRSSGDALETAGYDGMSKHVASVVNSYAIKWDEHALAYAGANAKVDKLSPRQVITFMEEHPELLEIAHYVADNYPVARARLEPTVATVLCWKIAQLHGIAVVDVFLDGLTDPDLLPEGHPVIALKKRLEPPVLRATDIKRGLVAKPMASTLKLAYATKAFNAMIADKKLTKLDIVMGEPFPEIAEPAAVTETEADAA